MQMKMILHDFEQFPKGLDWKYYCYGFKAAIVQINLMILGRSASKRPSEPGRYKVHSCNFFMRKFWILSLLNTDRSCRNICFKYIKKSKFRVVCSPPFKLNRIDQDIFLLYLYGMSLVLWKGFKTLELLASYTKMSKITQLIKFNMLSLATTQDTLKFPASTARRPRLYFPVLASYKGP